MESSKFMALLKTSVEDLKAKTKAHQNIWHFGEEERWNLEQDAGYLVFSFTNGTVARCPAQIIGTFSANDKTWLWSWANPSIKEELTVDARKLQSYGREHNLRKLTTAKWSSKQSHAWAMAALACKLCGGQGVYRGPAGPAYVFMTFGDVQLSKQ